MSSAYEAAIQNAFNVWSAATGITFEEVPDSAQTDIQIGWGSFNTANSGVVGLTNYQINNGQFSSGMEIRLEDPTEDVLVIGADGKLTYSGTQTELSQVLVHEIGHALGFADNADPNSIMYYALGNNNTTFDSTDLAGIQELYGSGQASGSISGNSSLNQLIQAMATFNVSSGAFSLPSQNYALTTNNMLSLVSGVGQPQPM
jgi:predicted Zn-dependent protease